ncbi:MAG TPA: hypothetical protein VND21_11655 [Planctomycetota bacterium]|jgi:hypothetical protein|nr:hypothetical protein [Planctomycetota bacterium]
MTDLLATLLAFEVGTTLKTVIGVLMALSGLGVLLMGVIAMADRALQKGGIAVGLGAALIAAGLWLVGAL